LAFGGQDEAVIFGGLQKLQISKTLLCVTSHSVKVSSGGCDSIINIPVMILSHHII
jgi:hypothetical protein